MGYPNSFTPVLKEIQFFLSESPAFLYILMFVFSKLIPLTQSFFLIYSSNNYIVMKFGEIRSTAIPFSMKPK